MIKKPHKVANVLEDGDQLGHLKRMLKKQQALLEQVRKILPAPLNEHCLHARIDAERLILHTDSPAWSTGLRFHAPRILKELRCLAPNLEKTDIRIMVEQDIRPTKTRRSSLPGETASLIRELADGLADSDLRAAFKHLGRASRDDKTG
ncbi:DUF721 domain-containing protein [Thiolapillus brandeum]|uniref:DUF721 domain-containing protein n=1 Tax=Thiolapillus brandeum TaxID=1076588 RepID=A0A7U6GH18_9GAMM|nr:DUF721 domain-containing protein [Thiolapillus brandeum]BAO43511.1 conserved hypothetical protein [Thiolapillus brandeum]